MPVSPLPTTWFSLALLLSMLPACASPLSDGPAGARAVPGALIQVETVPSSLIQSEDDRLVEARLGLYRLRLPLKYFRYQIEPGAGRRFELAMWLPEYRPVLMDPPVGSATQAAKLDIQVFLVEGVQSVDLLSLWMGQEPIGKSPDPLGGEHPRIRGEPVHGLSAFYVDTDVLVKQARARGEKNVSAETVASGRHVDRYLGNAVTDLKVPTYIECTTRALDDGMHIVDGQLRRNATANSDLLAVCDHSFMLDNTGIAVSMHYSRAYLSQWREIEVHVSNQLRQAIVAGSLSP